MYARVTTYRLAPEKLEEALRFGPEAIAPVARGQAGFRGLWVLVNPTTGKAVTLSLWETDADLQAAAVPAHALQAQAGSLLAEQPVVDTYEVRLQT